jgi:hypothetical protein
MRWSVTLPLWRRSGVLTSRSLPAYPLDQIAEAHEAVEAGSRGGRVLVALQPLAG